MGEVATQETTKEKVFNLLLCKNITTLKDLVLDLKERVEKLEKNTK